MHPFEQMWAVMRILAFLLIAGWTVNLIVHLSRSLGVRF